ncbi:MAG TPA: hypothetical protein EYP14_15290, partial [Planctomycetaceae bacterium]|nr:hypothetical protein [Planctomycetaceae bacterium]
MVRSSWFLLVEVQTLGFHPQHKAVLRRALLTLATMAGLSAVYGLYARSVGVLARPQLDHIRARRLTHDVPSQPGPPQENVEVARRHLPAWAAQAKYQLRDSEGLYYYTNQWNRMEAGNEEAVRFTPFALVWFRHREEEPEQPAKPSAAGASRRATSSSPEAFILVADAALIQFDSKFDMGATRFGNVVGGQLEGRVTIRGPNDLLIQGRNLIFRRNANRIWSDNAVEFQYGPHRGTADRGLQIELTPEDRPSGDPLAFAGVERILLRRHVTLNLRTREGEREVPVTIDCDGGFGYEVASHVAQFEENVRVRRQTGAAEFDSLECELLTLVLEERPEEPEGAAVVITPSGAATSAHAAAAPKRRSPKSSAPPAEPSGSRWNS